MSWPPTSATGSSSTPPPCGDGPGTTRFAGIVDTVMTGRVSGGTDEGRAAMVGQEPIGRMGRPEEIASAVLWLCSDLGGFPVGHALVVDGARTVGP